LKVRARVPEKQGLKQPVHLLQGDDKHRPGASSRKTRIETRQLTGGFVHVQLSGREFQKNKD